MYKQLLFVTYKFQFKLERDLLVKRLTTSKYLQLNLCRNLKTSHYTINKLLLTIKLLTSYLNNVLINI